MAYNELSLTGSDDDLGALETKYPQQDLASQIPGQTSAARQQAQPQAPKSLIDRAAAALMQAHPLMMGRSLVDTTKSLIGGMAVPVVAPYSAGIQALNAAPGNMYRRSRGEEEVKTPTVEELMRKYGEAVAPQTEMGEGFIGGVGKLMDVLKVPHAFPIVPNAPRRPMLTPTDVRVGAGQAKQLAREVREVPQDFQNAQSGLKRQNLYGEDTLGVKAQAAAESLGDTLERRKSSGKLAIPGVPGQLVPETNLYAVRPKGSRIVQPTIPETTEASNVPKNYLNALVQDVYGETPAKNLSSGEVFRKYSREFFRENQDFELAASLFQKKKLAEMFPDAPNVSEARDAFNNLYSSSGASDQKDMEFIEEFLSTPEGAPFREQGVPTPSEFTQRLAEGERLLKGPFVNFIVKNLGAEGDPTVQLARQGITLQSPERIRELATFLGNSANKRMVKNRELAGFPAEGSFVEEKKSKLAELEVLEKDIADLAAIRTPIRDQAHLDGIQPSTIPAYANSTGPITEMLRRREALQSDIENIGLGEIVENLGDTIVVPRTKKDVLEDLSYAQRQFFPSVTKAKDDESLYTLQSRGELGELGYKELAQDLFSDILKGKAGDTSKLTIEQYIKDRHLSKAKAAKASKAEENKRKQDLQIALLDRLSNGAGVEKYGDVSAVVSTKDTPKEVALRDASVDCLYLDHCVANAGDAPKGRKNILTGKQQRYQHIMDPITGKYEKNVSPDTQSPFVNALQQGNKLVSFRENKTGVPGATLELKKVGASNTFSIGWSSGAQNRAVDKAFVPAIRDYLNRHSAEIAGTGNHLADNTGIYDTTRPSEFKTAIRSAGLTRDQATALDVSTQLPRFVTVEDLKKMSTDIVALNQPAQMSRELADLPYELFQMDVDQDVPNFQAIENTIYGLRNGVIDHAAYRALPENQRAAAMNTTADQLQALVDERRAEMEGGDWEPDPTAVANRPGFFTQAERNALAAQGDPMPDNLDVTELLAEHADRLTTGQVRWLTDFSRRWDEDVDNTPAGAAAEEQMIREYDQWLSSNRLQPDPTAVAPQAQRPDIRQAQAPTPALPFDRVREIVSYVNEYPPDDLGSLVEGNPAMEAVLTRVFLQDAFPTVGQVADARELIANLARARSQNLAMDQEVERVNRLSNAELSRRNDVLIQRVPREIQRLDDAALVADMPTAAIQEANEIAREAFNNNDFGPGGAPLEVFQRIIRTQRTGLHADSAHTTRELAARTLDTMYDTAQREARDFADDLITNYQDELEPPGTLQALQANIRDLEQNGETAWAMMFGEAADDTPWNPTLGNIFIRHLRQEAIDLDNRIRGAEQIDEYVVDDLVDAFRDIVMDEDPADAVRSLQNTIRSLRRGEDGWEDALGMAADDTPWSFDLQRALIERLEAMMDEFRDLDDPEEYAKGGRVKKRMAKKPRTSLVVTRKSPELAEMAYRYGGMVI